MQTDTIAAISTPAGRGGIAVVRVSGSDALSIVDKIFVAKSGKQIADIATHRILYGAIQAGSEKIDDVLVSVFRAPHSFTGNDTVEIACHGSVYIQQKLLELLVAAGARLATAGEFTQRAFLNGKIDLAQAEAVADLIASESAAAHRVALQQLRGGFSDELKQLREQLLHFVSLLELELDFSEEEVEFADRTQFNVLLNELQTVIDRLLQSFSLGNAIKNGVPVAIVGKTNVGKSTLLNTLLGEERAIVSDVHGTTRDAIEDTITLNGVQFRFIDTAGIRHNTETIEQLGIERTYEKIRRAAIVLLLLDATRPETFSSVEEIKTHLSDAQKLIVVLNKIDAAPKKHVMSSEVETSHAFGNRFLDKLGMTAAEGLLSISAKTKQGIDELIAALSRAINVEAVSSDETIITNVRHYEALQRTQQALARVARGFAAHTPTDLIAQDIREALYHLGSITGTISTEEILGSIFSHFCIGK